MHIYLIIYILNNIISYKIHFFNRSIELFIDISYLLLHIIYICNILTLSCILTLIFLSDKRIETADLCPLPVASINIVLPSYIPYNNNSM